MTDNGPLIVITPEVEQPLVTLLRVLLDAERAEQVMTHGGAWVNGRRVLDETMLVPPGSHIALHRPPNGHYPQITIAPDDILYEDDWLIVLNKHAGWYTIATPWDIHSNVLVALGYFLQARDGEPRYVHLAHRLDRDTSGVLLCSRRPEANGPLQVAFTSRNVRKEYLGICTGIPEQDAFEVCTGHGRERNGRFRVYPLEEVGMPLPGGTRVRKAHTRFEVLRPLDGAALVRAQLLTGRTHQIRLHLAHVGHPLLGDQRYGGLATYGGQELPFHLLHAASLTLPHPHTRELLQLQAPLPDHIARFVVGDL